MTTPPREQPAWIDYSPPGIGVRSQTGGGGSTFFFPTGSGSSPLDAATNSPPTTPNRSSPLPDLPFPRSILLSSPHFQHTPPTLTETPFPFSSTSNSSQSPQQAPTGTSISYMPNLPRSNLPPSMTTSTKVPLAQSSSILAHSGFWDLLSATGSRFYSPSKINTRVQGANEEKKLKVKTERIGKGIASKPLGAKEGVMGGGGGGSREELEGLEGKKSEKEKMRVSKDMIGAPRAFAHLVHASDAEQAEALLMRWHLDKQGKLGQPSWAKPIKSAVREAKAAVGIAEATIARDEQRQQFGGQDQGALQVRNGLPDSAFSHLVDADAEASADTGFAVEDDSGEGKLSPPLSSPFHLEPLARSNSGDSIIYNQRSSTETVRPLPRRITRVPPPQLTPPESTSNIVLGTTKFSPHGYNRPGVPLSWDTNETTSSLLLTSNDSDEEPNSFESSLSDPFSLPSRYLPSLTTIEKAASTKIYLETKYHSLLKTPPSRETRKHLLEKELSRLNLKEEQKQEAREAFRLSETEYLRDMRQRINVGSFKRLKVIGRGAFGVVTLVREKGSGELYAMKQLRKSDMLKKGQEGHTRAERDLLARAATSTRWTVRLAYSFQDVDNLYLVMDAMMGGDLLTLLIEKDTFEESFARFYIAEMVLAIQETHQVLGAIHRDIKPDNFLFSNDGHIAISDFGLATDFHWSHDGAYFDAQRRELLYKHGIDLEDQSPRNNRNPDGRPPFDPPRAGDNESEEVEGPKSLLGWRDQNRRRMAYSVVGTNNYMAVEVLRGTGYQVQADWWSLGVIMFEMLYGYPPFVSKSRQQTRSKILNWRQTLRFPPKPRVSREAQDLILSLICEKEDRLGSRRTGRPNSVIQRQRSGFLNVAGTTAGLTGVANDGADEIKAHPWFKGIEWSTLHLQTPPFQPKLKDPTDTRYFEDNIEPVPLPAPEIAPGVPAPQTTRDPMLRHATEGDQLLELRKVNAFKNWTFKRPKKQVYDPRRGLDLSKSGDIFGKSNGDGTYRGRSTLRSDGVGSSFIRSLSV